MSNTSNTKESVGGLVLSDCVRSLIWQRAGT